MAAGKLGVYRGNEFRDRESDLGFSRRDYSYPRNEYHRQEHYRAHDLETRKGYSRGGGGRDSYSQKDNRKREERERDDRCDSSLNGARRSGSGDGRGRAYSKPAEREPGEISSGSESDGSIAYAPEVNGRGASMPPRKKIKITPVGSNREEKKGMVPNFYSLPCVTKCSHQSPQVHSPKGVQKFPKSDELISFHEHSPAINLPDGSLVSPLGSSFFHQERQGINDRETEQLEEEDGIPKTSRWADDESDISDYEEMHKTGKSTTASGSSAITSSSRSPESSFRSECHVFKNDGVYVEKNAENNSDSFHDSDTDLDEAYDDHKILELEGLQRDVNMPSGSRSVREFENLNFVNKGTYGAVYRGRNTRNGEVVALKKVIMEKEREGFPLTALREINILMSLSHSSIVDVKEVVVDEDLKKDKTETYLVMEYMEHDLRGLLETMEHPFSQSEVKCLMLQLLEGVKYLHDNWVLHRDLKTSNLLFNNRGEMKICDFGMSRQYGSPAKPYTPLVVTMWYRAPELLLGAKQYSTAIDMWSVGCIMAELLAKEPLFCGKSEIDQLNKIFETLGTPSEADWPEFSDLPGSKFKFVRQKYNLLRQKFPPTSFTGSPSLSAAGLDLLNKLLTYDPKKRITAEDAVNHEWFREFPLPKAKDLMPTFPAEHANARRQHRSMRSPYPSKEPQGVEMNEQK